jgi:ADP-heptose:LPS heptosyltransferase
LLRHVLAFVGVVSFLAHATNATGTPAVVLFGPSAPNVWAHRNQLVINKSVRCALCIDTLAGHPCPYGAPCLGDISVAEVGEALRAQLTSSRIARTSSDAAVHAW